MMIEIFWRVCSSLNSHFLSPEALRRSGLQSETTRNCRSGNGCTVSQYTASNAEPKQRSVTESPPLLVYVEEETSREAVVDGEYLSGFCFQLWCAMVLLEASEKQLFSTPSL